VPDAVRIDAPAKVNLRLCVLARETTGFHALETVFCAVSLGDTVEVRRSPAAGIELRATGSIDMGSPERNLAVRAAERFLHEIGGQGDRRTGIQITLQKRIPSAAGLGGGSSDAAATLGALNALHDEPLTRDVLLQLASELGSDVPFFLCGSPLALAWGRGERLLSLPPLPPRPVLVAHPGTDMPTGAAFDRIAGARGGSYRVPASALDLAALQSWKAVARIAENDFQPVAEEQVPAIRRARAAMLDEGAEVALLSGSGASVFGVFEHARDRDSALRRLRGEGWAVWPAETLQAMPAPQVDPPQRLE
jgi:4-diphosphocytidyl-2-C-methyl-D-erythritol kinase